MFAVALFSDEKDVPFVGLITDRPDRSNEIVEIASRAESYKFIRAGTETADSYMARAFEILHGMRGECNGDLSIDERENLRA